MLRGKIHRARVTEANVDYEGSITIDEALLEAADILPYENVHVVDVDNGARFETYTMAGKRHTGVICLNGGAARLVQPGDKIIIIAYSIVSDEEARRVKPKLVFVDQENRIVKRESVLA
jgi:aspartate 1-decarboxylase